MIPAAFMKSSNDINHDKRNFIPFKDERDHLGRIIDSVRMSYFYSDSLVTSELHADPTLEAIHQETSRFETQEGWHCEA